MRLVPQIGHLVVEVHVVRQHRFSRDGVRAGNHPVVRARNEFGPSREPGCAGRRGPRARYIAVRAGIHLLVIVLIVRPGMSLLLELTILRRRRPIAPRGVYVEVGSQLGPNLGEHFLADQGALVGAVI